ncbi:hypothetical protein BJQ90_00415 [Arthrobacter sp. SO3]|nr:hypothetical protein [Arthrobacter sp. SO3]
MCGACGRTVVTDPILGPVRTMRQHLIVAQTINSICHSRAGAPKVAATSEGWLVTGPTGSIATVATVEKLWAAILRDSPGKLRPELPNDVGSLADGESGEISLRVRAAGHRVWNEISGASAHGSDPSRKETK